MKAAREKHQITYRWKPIQITANFSTQTLKCRRAWNNILQAMKEHGCQPRILYPEKITFRFEDEIKSFHDKEKLIEFTNRNMCYTTFPEKIFYEKKMKENNVGQQREEVP